MPLGEPISTTAPAGYDQALWDSIPSVRAQKNRGKHETYVFGQSSADGTACTGCSWQASRVLSRPISVAQHDRDMGLAHDHGSWVPLEHGPMRGTCPCQNESKEQER